MLMKVMLENCYKLVLNFNSIQFINFCYKFTKFQKYIICYKFTNFQKYIIIDVNDIFKNL